MRKVPSVLVLGLAASAVSMAAGCQGKDSAVMASEKALEETPAAVADGRKAVQRTQRATFGAG